MPLFVKFAYWETVLLFGGFLGVVLGKLLTGSIPLSYLLDGHVRDPNSANGFSSQASTGRAQTLVVTLFVAGYYLLQVIRNPTELPRLPVPMVMALGGSHAFYLAGKARDLFEGR
ncbi:MAG TPA: hypothetical protein VMQ17_22575 [Candidatus Sulfotelmatobacter sp.]|nr:hypothetical protein [Candidatus Sulfotelmatobacter sp.]